MKHLTFIFFCLSRHRHHWNVWNLHRHWDSYCHWNGKCFLMTNCYWKKNEWKEHYKTVS